MKVVADSSLLNVPKDLEFLYYQGFHVYDITGTKLTTQRSPCPQILRVSVSHGTIEARHLTNGSVSEVIIRETKSKGAINKRVVRRCQHYHITSISCCVKLFTTLRSLRVSVSLRKVEKGREDLYLIPTQYRLSI